MQDERNVFFTYTRTYIVRTQNPSCVYREAFFFSSPLIQVELKAQLHSLWRHVSTHICTRTFTLPVFVHWQSLLSWFCVRTVHGMKARRCWGSKCRPQLILAKPVNCKAEHVISRRNPKLVFGDFSQVEPENTWWWVSTKYFKLNYLAILPAKYYNLVRIPFKH